VARHGDDEGPSGVFGVGRGVDPETSGVWMYHRRIQRCPGAEPLDVLFLDTEVRPVF
jgi:hypothetical protein